MRAEGNQFAIETAQGLTDPLPTPPQHLSPGALRYWPAVVGSKRRSAWSEADLLLACQLARDYDAAETMTATLDAEGPVLERDSGSKYANPLCNLLDKVSRRLVLTSRALQIHSIATSGKTDHQGNKNETARDIAGKLASVSDLIPRARASA